MSRSSTTRIFVCAERRFCGHNAGQSCWELKIGFPGEPVRVRTDCLEKTVYFPLTLFRKRELSTLIRGSSG